MFRLIFFLIEFEHDGVSYRLVADEKTWDAAEQHCATLGGHLATISSTAANTAFHNKIKSL